MVLNTCGIDSFYYIFVADRIDQPLLKSFAAAGTHRFTLLNPPSEGLKAI
jgi:hypothetical protein